MTATPPEENRPEVGAADPWSWSGSQDATDPPTEGIETQKPPTSAPPDASAPTPTATTSSGSSDRADKKVKTSAGWPVAFFLCGIAMVVGSRQPWTTVGSSTISGTAHGGAGEVSFVAGIVLIAVTTALILLGGSLLPATRRLLGQLAVGAAGAGFGISVYVIDHLSAGFGSNASPGWGLILVLVASIAALITSVAVTVSATD